ncbi:MAG TPA: response regulator transcription factor [Polyangiaceae bacterium]|jgi:two-component system phosphate regulon response regulator PhoB|nr:response regulator transcription factor [Polyangiaceae bacterium]
MSDDENAPGASPEETDEELDEPGLELEPKARVVLVTNDASIGAALEAPLGEAGHRVSLFREGRPALQALKASGADLVVLDLVLPDVQGLEICRVLRGDRTTRAIPILVITSRSEEMDRVIAFEVGVDDFVPAPFSIREVLLRIRVLLRPRPIARTAAVLSVGALSLDARSHRVWVNKEEVTLSVREFRLLEALMTRRDRVLPRPALLEIVWGGADVGARSVDAYVTRLRRKLGAARDYVETVSSVGYRLKSPTE